MFDNLDFFRLVERNRHAVEVMLDVRRARTTPRCTSGSKPRRTRRRRSVAEQVRMIAALGAVTGFDDWAPTLLREADPLTLQTELTATVRDMLRVTQPV